MFLLILLYYYEDALLIANSRVSMVTHVLTLELCNEL